MGQRVFKNSLSKFFTQFNSMMVMNIFIILATFMFYMDKGFAATLDTDDAGLKKTQQEGETKKDENSSVTDKEDDNTPEDSSKKTRKYVMKEIVIKGQQFKEKESPYTINIFDSSQIEKMGLSRTADIVKEVPGAKMAEYNQGGITNAVAMRGFANGVHGDDLGLYLDGIPLNEVMGHGGGYADPNVIIPLEIEKVLIYKGPVSALYGNFSKAGTMAYFTRKKGDYDIISTQYGSNNTSDVQAAIGTKLADNFWNNTAVQFYRTDGYSQNSDQLLGNASTRFTFDPTQNLEISISLRAHANVWNAPGYIPESQLEHGNAFKQGQSPYATFFPGHTPYAQKDGGDRSQFCERLDIGYRMTNNLKINFWGFGSETDWTRYDDRYWKETYQREHDYNIYKAGGGTNINYSDSLLNLTTGLEYYSDGTKYKKYNDVDRVRQGDAAISQKARLDNYVFLAEGELKLHPLFRPTAGVRIDAFTGDFKDRLTGEHDSFNVNRYDHISPKAGFRSTLIEETLDFRGSVCNGYVMPTTDIIFVNKSVKPSNMWQYELGSTLTKKDLILLDVAGFILDTYNEIQADPNDPNNSLAYKNNGTTRRMGIETATNIKPVKYIEIYGNYSWISTDIRKNPDHSLVGKSLTTIPQSIAKAGLRAELLPGAGVKAELIYVGKSYISSDNSLTYGGYNLLNVGVFYRIITENAKNIDLAFEVKNVFNKLYAAYAGGPYTFSTGAPRTYWASVNTKW